MKSKIILLILLVGIVFESQAQMVFNEEYKRSLDAEYTSGVFKGFNNAYMLVPDSDPAALASFTVFQYLQGRVAGLIIDNSRTYSPTASWRMSATSFFLNEMQVDASVLATVNMNDIGLIKVFRPPFVGARGNGPGGAIAVYTLLGDEEE
jgi:hypothetical protein